MIEVVGHFGTLYSYATVGGRVAEALRDAGLLARVRNIDAEWHPGWKHLADAGTDEFTHCIVFAAPHQYVQAYAGIYGKRSAIFVSPNTSALDGEHAETIASFGLAIAPSRFCSQVVATAIRRTIGPPVVAPAVLPIGSPVRDGAERRSRRRERLLGRLSNPPVVLHLTSDQAWPGRKGTEELLDAWAIMGRRGWRPGARLVIHGPPSIHKMVLYRSRDLVIDETVSYRESVRRGESDEVLSRLYDEADLVVQPSRSEGFGMMILAAIDAGVPLVTTYNTGHAEFLRDFCGSWVGVSTPGSGPMAFEVGDAPIVEPDILAHSTALALLPSVRESLLFTEDKRGDSWHAALGAWVERLSDWIKEDA